MLMSQLNIISACYKRLAFQIVYGFHACQVFSLVTVLALWYFKNQSVMLRRRFSEVKACKWSINKALHSTRWKSRPSLALWMRASQIFNLELQLCYNIQADTHFHLRRYRGESSCVYPPFVLSRLFLSHNHACVCERYKMYALHIIKIICFILSDWDLRQSSDIVRDDLDLSEKKKKTTKHLNYD